MFQIQRVRSYHPDPDHWDKRPACLNFGFVALTQDELACSVSSALSSHGNVVIEKAVFPVSQPVSRELEDEEMAYLAHRRGKAEEAERRRP